MPNIFGVSVGGNVNAESEKINTSNQSKATGQQVTQTQYSQAAVDRMFYSALQENLANIIQGQNLVGGNSSSTQTLEGQDFLSKLMGEIATKTATQVTQSTQDSAAKTNTSKSKKSGGLKTVICTRLKDLGYISLYIYTKGNRYAVPSITQHRGYMAWAPYVVPFLGAKNPRFTEFWKKLVLARYYYHIEPAHLRAHNIWSFLGVGILGKFSTLVGKLLNAKDAVKKHLSLTWEELKRG